MVSAEFNSDNFRVNSWQKEFIFSTFVVILYRHRDCLSLCGSALFGKGTVCRHIKCVAESMCLQFRKTRLCCTPQYMIRIISLCLSGPIIFRIKCQVHPDFAGWLNSPSSSWRGFAFLPKCCDRHYFKYVQRIWLSERMSQSASRPSESTSAESSISSATTWYYSNQEWKVYV